MKEVFNIYRKGLLEELARIATLPQVEQLEESSSSNAEEQVLRYRPIVLDRAWMADREAASTNKQYNKLMDAIGNLNVSGIADIDGFIGTMNNFMSQPVDVSDHRVAISRADVLRTFYHLLTSPNEQSKGYDFEMFLGYVFNGQVRPPSEDGIVDIEFSDTNISAKFIKPDGRIKGSIKDLQSTVQQDRGVNFIVATKGRGADRGVVRFYSFTVDRGNIDKIPESKGQMNLSLTKLASNSDIFYFQEMSNSPLDLRGCVELTEEIFSALNQKFQNLLAELQGLVDQVDDLMYKSKDAGETKKSAGRAKDKAEKVKKKAGEIESKS